MGRRVGNWYWPGRLGARDSVVLFAGIGVAMTLVAVASPAGAPSPLLAHPRVYGTGDLPNALAIGDLNADGNPDIVSNGGPNVLSFLLNRGNGTFRPRRAYPVRNGATSIAIRDLNGDGKPDLATASSGDNSISVFLSRGAGSFRPRRDYRVGGSPRSLAIADLNGDGKPDLASANSRTSTVSVLLNAGDGSFYPRHDYRTGAAPVWIAIGDLNGDGKPDLATANNLANTVSVLLNAGNGGFQAKADYRVGYSPVSVALGDLNGDSKPDLVTGNFSAPGTVSVLLNGGGARFPGRRDYRAGGFGNDPVSAAIGDLTGDGKPDVVAASADQVGSADTEVGILSVLVNQGDGSSWAKRDYQTRDAQYESLALGDLNGDGKPDVVTVNQFSGGVSVLLNATGSCGVPSIRGATLAAATRAISRAHCRIGTIGRAYSSTVKKGRVISENPRFGVVLPRSGRVSLVVSRGRKR